MRLMRFAAKEVPATQDAVKQLEKCRAQTDGQKERQRERERKGEGCTDRQAGIVSFVLRKIKIKLLMAITHLR